MREGVFIIPPTPSSILAKAFKKICQEELRGTNLQMSVTERGGKRLGNELGVTVPGASRRKACRREKCFPCSTGQAGICKRTGIGYQIDCNVCKQSNISSKYAGEKGRNLFQPYYMHKGSGGWCMCGCISSLPSQALETVTVTAGLVAEELRVFARRWGRGGRGQLRGPKKRRRKKERWH